MGKMSRDKGRRFELAVYHAAQACGLSVDPGYLSQSSDFSDKPDLVIADRRCECKCREDNPKRFWEWLTNNKLFELLGGDVDAETLTVKERG